MTDESELPPWSPFPVRWGPFRRVPDVTADEWLGRLLMYRERAESDPREAGRWAGRVLSEGRRLFEGVVGWALSFKTNTDHDAGFNKLPVEDRRALFADRLGLVPGLPGAAEFAEALLALNAGQVNDLLKPSQRPTNRKKGPRPYERAGAELLLLQWRAFRVATGEREANVEEELADAIGVTTGVFDPWKRRLSKEMPEELEGFLALAEELGRDVAAGMRIVGPERRELVARWQRKKRYLAYLVELFRKSRSG